MLLLLLSLLCACLFVFGHYMFHFLFVVIVVSQFELSPQKKSKTKTRILTDAAAIEAQPHTYSTHTHFLIKHRQIFKQKKKHTCIETQLYKKEIFFPTYSHSFICFFSSFFQFVFVCACGCYCCCFIFVSCNVTSKDDDETPLSQHRGHFCTHTTHVTHLIAPALKSTLYKYILIYL